MVLLPCVQADRLYQLLIGDSIAEFRWHWHSLNTVHLIENQLSVEVLKCPACPKVSFFTMISYLTLPHRVILNNGVTLNYLNNNEKYFKLHVPR